ncbi:hypothetical protein LTR08_002567 [Meristemomyces frigidus]|nr:hypothetical protein LTR08_002567 [Meristemomyces frigidus]
MAPFRLRSFIWTFTAFASVSTAIDNNADPITLAFSNNASVGPDGPWWYIPQAIEYPDNIVALIPSLTRTSLIINSSTCSAQTADCPVPIGNSWAATGAFAVSGGPGTVSIDVDARDWAPDLTALMGMQGSGQYIDERMTLYSEDDPDQGDYLDGHAFMLSNGFAATFPGGASYTLDTGFVSDILLYRVGSLIANMLKFSLYGSPQTVSWTTANGSSWATNRTLPDAYGDGYIPSTSYGLHIGSVFPNVTASLVLGGYDSSRCLTEPIVSDTQAVQLVGIAVNVSSGASAFSNSNSTSAYVEGLLRANGSALFSLDVEPDPGVPYMYLPRSTCDAIATLLPVTYEPDFGLYFWNTEEAAYEQIISSPHYLAFTFATSVGLNPQTINVPFAQLNLTLESPLITPPARSYFPCSPWDNPGTTPHHLGRAFLQAAFLAQNWQTGKLFLAQAPGPDFQPVNRKTIGHTDTTLAPATNPPDWTSTWASTLKDLPASSSPTPKPSSLSGGAIAGIVVGSIVALAIVAAVILWRVRRRRQLSRRDHAEPPPPSVYAHLGSPGAGSLPPGYHDGSTGSRETKPVDAVYEVDGGTPPPAEMDAYQVPGELDAQQQQHGK